MGSQKTVASSGATKKTSIIKTNKGDATKIIGIGDSITAARISWIDHLGGKKYARGDWSSTRIRNQIFDKYIITKNGKVLKKPKYLVIFAGINNHSNPDQVIADLKNMSERAQAAGIAVKLVKLFPSASWWSKSKSWRAVKDSLAKVKRINDWIGEESWTAAAGSGAIETSSMSDKVGKLIDSRDGLHPNSAGQKKLAALIKKSGITS